MQLDEALTTRDLMEALRAEAQQDILSELAGVLAWLRAVGLLRAAQAELARLGGELPALLVEVEAAQAERARLQKTWHSQQYQVDRSQSDIPAAERERIADARAAWQKAEAEVEALADRARPAVERRDRLIRLIGALDAVKRPETTALKKLFREVYQNGKVQERLDAA